MRRTLAAVVAVLGLSLTACGGDSGRGVDAAPTPTPVEVTVTATPDPIESPEPGPTPEETTSVDPGLTDSIFVRVVRDSTNGFEFEGVPDSLMISTAKEACGAWRRGGTIRQTAAILMENGFSPEASGALLGAGGEAYCPGAMRSADTEGDLD